MGGYAAWCRSYSMSRTKSGYLSRSTFPNPIPSTSLSVHQPIHLLSLSDALTMLSDDAMVRTKIITYAMLTPKRRYQIEQEIWERRVTRVAIRLPPNSSEPEEGDEPKKEEDAHVEEEEGEELHPAPMEVEQPEQEVTPAPTFAMA